MGCLCHALYLSICHLLPLSDMSQLSLPHPISLMMLVLRGKYWQRRGRAYRCAFRTRYEIKKCDCVCGMIVWSFSGEVAYTSIDPKQVRRCEWENRRSLFPTLIGKWVVAAHAHATPKPRPHHAQAMPTPRPSHAHATPTPRPRHAHTMPKPTPRPSHAHATPSHAHAQATPNWAGARKAVHTSFFSKSKPHSKFTVWGKNRKPIPFPPSPRI